jgi:NADH:ubiquinone oxidoreductase subunit F (NADH-binding)/(2Fe-2S) ferredoxin/NAD-dependent dihydropyrimidine dehydrogenase PreA subunit
MSIYRLNIMVCGGTGCMASKSQEIVDNFKDILKEKGYDQEVQVLKTGCFGFCEQGPIIKIHPDNIFYVKVTPEDVEEIVNEHIIKGRKVERLLYEDPDLKEKINEQSDMSFYKPQLRIALRNCGLINPEDIFEYIAYRGYEALGTVLKNQTPEDVVNTMIKSNLRGRGGGGFPAGLKWKFANQAPGDEKYIICNADEGDPGAFMDRSILEGDPHSVLEAMAIAGYAIGAETGLIYIRAEYPLAIKRLEIAIEQAKEQGLLGNNIFGSDFNFNIRLKYGAGAFVCGEETALIASTEGLRGEPRNKPPFPATSGFKGKPTNVNNVETLANVPPIILNGPEWFNKIGTEKSNGTKVFALAGAINNVGLVEVPMGTTLREIVYDIGGGIRGGKAFKAVQTGGPSGGVITTKDLDTPIDYDSLQAIGSMMGSGGMIVMDEDTCMVNIAKFYLDFTQEESCGKCTPCRIGTKRIFEYLEKITEGNATMDDLHNLRELCEAIKDTALCGLGQTAPNPVLRTMDYYWDEYVAHVNGHCPAKECKALLSYTIDAEKCIGCTACIKKCPVDCITGERKEPHVIDEAVCIKCGACYEVCPVDAVIKP